MPTTLDNCYTPELFYLYIERVSITVASLLPPWKIPCPLLCGATSTVHIFMFRTQWNKCIVILKRWHCFFCLFTVSSTYVHCQFLGWFSTHTMYWNHYYRVAFTNCQYLVRLRNLNSNNYKKELLWLSGYGWVQSPKGHGSWNPGFT